MNLSLDVQGHAYAKVNEDNERDGNGHRPGRFWAVQRFHYRKDRKKERAGLATQITLFISMRFSDARSYVWFLEGDGIEMG